MSNLSSISGNLDIRYYDNLTSLNGLDNLGSIDIGAYESQAVCSLFRYSNDVKEIIPKEINIYPTPAKHVMNIETKLKNISVTILDVLDRTIIQSNHKNIIDISRLNKGIYLLQFYQDGKIVNTKRLIKE